MQQTAITIIKKLQDNGYQALFAGGCVRDLLLKKDPEDFDIATNAKPETIEHLFEKTYPIGKHFGVILINENNHHFEIATFRSDAGYTDGRRPEYVTFTNAKEDANRRDFTINGIFHDPITKKFHDYVHGITDLKRGLLRFIGHADQRIQEDHLRMLRAIRFKNRFHLEYEEATQKAIQQHKSLILGVSAERIRDELNKIITHASRKQAFEDLLKLGLLEEIIPELTALKNIPQTQDYHSEGDVLTHSLLALKKVFPKTSLECLWAILLHDIGKSQTFKYAEGRIHFYAHQEVAIDIARKILNRLKFSNTSKKKILWLIHHHHLFDQFQEMKTTRKLHYFDNPYFPDLLKLHRADLLSSIPKDFKKRKEAEAKLHEIKAEYLLAQKEKHLPSRLPDLLSGQEIMNKLNIPAGPNIGIIKKQLQEKQLEKKIQTKEEALKWLKTFSQHYDLHLTLVNNNNSNILPTMKKYSRILLKLSGEALLGEKEFGIDYSVLDKITAEIAEIHKLGIEVVVVIGAGNIWRGANHESGIDRVPSDYIGMMATIMNSVALQASLEKIGLYCRVCSALNTPSVAEPYIRRKAVRHLEKKRIVICAAGTGNPYFTTDSAASLRALELNCEVLIKATNVDGVYDADPRKNAKAQKYTQVTFDEVLEKDLKVMDATSVAQCRDNKLPIIVFELMKKGNLKKIIEGQNIGTQITL